MRDHDDDGAARAQAENGAGQRFVAFGVEIGIGFVEHDQERIAIKRARQRDALRLAGGQRAAVLADIGLVTVRQIDDEIVNAGRLRGGEHGLGSGGSSKREMFCATLPGNNSTSCGT
jgi:hypothetical protein